MFKQVFFSVWIINIAIQITLTTSRAVRTPEYIDKGEELVLSDYDGESSTLQDKNKYNIYNKSKNDTRKERDTGNAYMINEEPMEYDPIRVITFIPKLVQEAYKHEDKAVSIKPRIFFTISPRAGYVVPQGKDLKAECKSTGYYPGFGWVSVKQRTQLIKEPRPYLKSLRESIYKEQNPEICHQPDQTNVLAFLECQVRRHMRLELAVPKYPEVPG